MKSIYDQDQSVPLIEHFLVYVYLVTVNYHVGIDLITKSLTVKC